MKILGIEIRESAGIGEWYDVFLTAPDREDTILASCPSIALAKNFASKSFEINLEKIIENTAKI